MNQADTHTFGTDSNLRGSDYTTVVSAACRTELAGKRFHFIGAGGIGMSGLAQLLVKNKAVVAGSDQEPGRIGRFKTGVGRLAQEVDATQVDRHDRVKIILGHLGNRFTAVGGSAVDQDIQPSQGCASFGHQLSTFLYLGQVGRQGYRPPANLLYQSTGFVDLVRIPTVDANRCPRLG